MADPCLVEEGEQRVLRRGHAYITYALAVAAIVFFGGVTFYLPMLKELFDDFGVCPPVWTIWALRVPEVLWAVIGIVIAGAFIGLKFVPRGRGARVGLLVGLLFLLAVALALALGLFIPCIAIMESMAQ